MAVDQEQVDINKQFGLPDQAVMGLGPNVEAAPNLEVQTEQVPVSVTPEAPVAQPEQIQTPEQQLEEMRSGGGGQQTQTPPTATPHQATAMKYGIDPVLFEEVETDVANIMVDGLEDIFHGLPEAKQAKFKSVGDEVAEKIAVGMIKFKIGIREIIKLLKAWLKIIPGVNKYFLEQEAKIKADRLMTVEAEFQKKHGLASAK